MSDDKWTSETDLNYIGMVNEGRSRQWYVAQVPSRSEHRAQSSLQERGFDAYVPTELHWTKHARKKTRTKRAILPRYLFISLDETQSHYAARQAVPNLTFLSLCGKPDRIPTQWVETFRTNEELGHFDFTKDAPTMNFAKDEVVRIIDGPYAGALAKIMRVKPGQKRVDLFLKGMDGSFRDKANVLVSDLEAAA